jgi:hypothetical protein
MPEPLEAEGDSFHAFDEVVAASMGPLVTSARCQAAPPHDGAAELADLGRAGAVVQVVPEPIDERVGQLGIGVGVDRPHHFLGVPGGAHLTSRITGVEEAEQPVAAMVVEPFVGTGQQPAAPVERIVLAAAMTHGLVDAATDLVELGVGQPQEMKRVGDLDGVGQHRVEHGPIGPDRSNVFHRIRSHHIGP